ncbi:MAG: polyketide biosynthesis enoyl-CoA hydratase PksH [Pseudomonadota bacterium]|nr:polyketide biosynthesis enoyl-CoA hydratase PksH [Pseudomonadota bacterium]
MLRRRGRALIATLNRLEAHNALDGATLDALNQALDQAEAEADVRLLVIAGQPGVFCTGTDFTTPVDATTLGPEVVAMAARRYYRLLARFAASPRLIVCQIDGRTQAGGIGLAAACDYALCTPRSTFNLPEVRLGLIPAVVLPFLIQRIGWQRAYTLTLTARMLDAPQALALGLVDEVGADSEEALRRLLLTFDRVPMTALNAAKTYSQALRPPLSATEDQAVAQIMALLSDPTALEMIRTLQQHGLWQQG